MCYNLYIIFSEEELWAKSFPPSYLMPVVLTNAYSAKSTRAVPF